MFPRLRQVALVARDLEPAVAALCDVFDVEPSYRDPAVGVFGLHNAVIPIGNQFLEVVSPIRDDTSAGRFLDRRCGDGGYMVIVQTGDGDLSADRDRMRRAGIRIVWETELDDIATLHLHPRDVGAAILSLDVARPADSWRWAGPQWERHVRTNVVHGIAGVEIQAEHPDLVAERWAEVLGIDGAARANGLEIALSNAVLRFTEIRDDRGEGIVAIDLAATDRKRAIDTAHERGLPVDDGAIQICGTWFKVV